MKINAGHGCVEVHRFQATTTLNDFPTLFGVQQLFRLEPRAIRHGATTTKVVYDLTSLSPARTSAAQLHTFTHEHWHCENKSHWVRDVTFDEDRAQVCQGALSEVLATLRNAVIGFLRVAGHPNIA